MTFFVLLSDYFVDTFKDFLVFLIGMAIIVLILSGQILPRLIEKYIKEWIMFLKESRTMTNRQIAFNTIASIVLFLIVGFVVNGFYGYNFIFANFLPAVVFVVGYFVYSLKVGPMIVKKLILDNSGN